MVIERADGKRFTARVSVLFVAKHEANQPIAHEGN
jgi:hypothetical protein